MRTIGTFTAVVLIAMAQAAQAQTPTPVINTTYGPIQGFEMSGINNFLGVPYATPPLASLRWKPPTPPTPWTTTLQTVAYSNFCPQGTSELSLTGGGSEDCLYLNVQGPTNATATSNLPVMVWIHGGGLSTGSGEEYNATNLIQSGNVVVVTFNYRLGLLGFLGHPALAAESNKKSSGNYGTLDQQAALAWVRANIANFGGNPNNITIFGESAGGQSVITQLVSPLTGKLHAAIIESGTYASTFPTQAQAQTQGVGLATSLNCPGTNAQTAACLRALPATALVQAAGAADFGVTIAPNVDNWVVTQQPFQAVAAGNFQHVPVIDGTNHDEYRLFVSEQDLADALGGLPIGYTAPEYQAFVQASAGNFTPEVLAEYPVTNYQSPNYAVATVATDFAFACNAIILDALLAKYVPVYAYEFNDPSPPNVFLPYDPYMIINDSHAIELPYLFPQFKNVALGIGPAQFSAGQSRLSAGMQASWTSFARYRVPLNPRGGAWAPYSVASRNFTSLVSPAPQQGYTGFFLDHKCDFWGPIELYDAGLPANTQY